MPVRVKVTGAAPSAASVTLSAEGALPTVLPLAGGKADAVVPWLVLRAPLSGARWAVGDSAGKVLAEGAIEASLKPLDEDEGLVAYFEGDARELSLAMAELLPGRKVVAVQLPLAPPLLTPPAAYQTVDLLLLGPAAANHVNVSQMAAFLAGGGVVAVRSGPNQRPEGGWPWQRAGAWWVLGYTPLGPRSLVEMSAYNPTYGWEHGWPADLRRRVVLAAALVGIALLALSLWRWRYAAVAGAALALATTVAITVWSGRQSPVLSAGGALVIWDGSMAQRDYWTYRTTLRDAETSIPWHAEPWAPPPAAPATKPSATQRAAPAPAAAPPAVLSVPVFASRAHVRQLGAKLVCRPDGQPDRFVAHLPADTTFAVLSRSVNPERPTVRPVSRVTPVTPGAAPESHEAGSAVTSPLIVLADPLYPGTVTGSVVEDDRPEGKTGQWQTIFIDAAQ